MEEAKKIWQALLGEISTNVSTVCYDLWFTKLEPLTISGNSLVVVAPLKNNKTVVTKDYKDIVDNAISSINTYITNLVVITPDEKKLYKEQEISEKPAEYNHSSCNFNPMYTFDSFVVGSSNQIAFAAAKAVAENPGGQFNPLFIYGGVGLGKTHIINAIGNYVLSKNPKAKILYSTTEQFVNDFIDSFANSHNNENNRLFREKYRNVDILMLDDIQFLKNKSSCQEALFHTFNDLYQSQKQIVFTSDRHPKELTFIEERLQSRFQSGFSIDITPPDLETKIAILQKKAYERKAVVSPSVIYFIADNISSNIRELEGALIKFTNYCKLLNIEANSIDIAKEILKEDINVSDHIISIDSIVDATCTYYGVPKTDVMGKKKTKQIVLCRQVAIYLINDILGVPLITIGNFFGKDHTTISYTRDKIDEMDKTDKLIHTQIMDIKNIIQKR